MNVEICSGRKKILTRERTWFTGVKILLRFIELRRNRSEAAENSDDQSVVVRVVSQNFCDYTFFDGAGRERK